MRVLLLNTITVAVIFVNSVDFKLLHFISKVYRIWCQKQRGKIKLKPFFGDPITADLVYLSMSLPDKDAINVWCAVVDKASDDLILSFCGVQSCTAIHRIPRRRMGKRPLDIEVSCEISGFRPDE